MKKDIELYDKDAFNKMHAAGKLAADVLDYITQYVKSGVSTGYLNDLCHDYIINNNAVPAPLNYRGFPKSCCTSTNHVVCHGIPSSDKILKEGDIVNVDVTALKDGWHGDTSRTFEIGEVSVKAKKLVKITYEALMKAIEIVKNDLPLGDIGAIIQNYVEAEGFSVVQDFCGHGIGKQFHKEPNVLHYGKAGTGEKIKTGMIFTIEPMINLGKFETKTLNDGWTAVTKDKSLSAQFEHTIGVTEDGCEIFTLSKNK